MAKEQILWAQFFIRRIMTECLSKQASAIAGDSGGIKGLLHPATSHKGGDSLNPAKIAYIVHPATSHVERGKSIRLVGILLSF